MSIHILKVMFVFNRSFIKKTREVHQVTTSEIEWQPVTTSATMSDNEGQWVVRRMTSSGTTSDIEWQRMTTNDNEWQQMTMSDSKW